VPLKLVLLALESAAAVACLTLHEQHAAA